MSKAPQEARRVLYEPMFDKNTINIHCYAANFVAISETHCYVCTNLYLHLVSSKFEASPSSVVFQFPNESGSIVLNPLSYVLLSLDATSPQSHGVYVIVSLVYTHSTLEFPVVLGNSQGAAKVMTQ